MKAPIICLLFLFCTLVFAQIRTPILTSTIRTQIKPEDPEPTPIPTRSTTIGVRTPIIRAISLPTIDAY